MKLKKAQANLDRRVKDFNSMKETKGFNKPGSMTGKK